MSSILKKFRKAIRFFTFSDLILTAIIIVIALILLYNNLGNKSSLVRINYHNKLIGEYRLDKAKIITITEEIQVEIANGKVRMLKNDCPNQLCVQQGWSNRFPIICVPNQVEIVIIDNDNKNEIRHILK